MMSKKQGYARFRIVDNEIITMATDKKNRILSWGFEKGFTDWEKN
jgi:hypothetical protein